MKVHDEKLQNKNLNITKVQKFEDEYKNLNEKIIETAIQNQTLAIETESLNTEIKQAEAQIKLKEDFLKQKIILEIHSSSNTNTYKGNADITFNNYISSKNQELHNCIMEQKTFHSSLLRVFQCYLFY